MTTRKKTATPKKKQKRSSKKKSSGNQRLRVFFAILFLLAFVVACLMSLVVLRDNYLPQSQVLQYEEDPLPPEPRHELEYEQVYALVAAELLNGPDSNGWQKLPADGSVQRLKMFGDYPAKGRLAELAAQISQLGAPSVLDLLPRKGLVRVLWQGELRLELRYRVPIEMSSSRPKIAIIMDDMGRSMKTFQRLLDLDLLITPAILPETGRATDGAIMFQRAGREYMIHIPMQPSNYPQTNPGPNALLLGQTEQKTRQLVRRYMELVPGAAGGNNHMGSRYTSERVPMRLVLEELRQNGQFFVDSKTISTSVGYDEARRMGVPTAARNIFLDNKDQVDYIRQQIRKMVRLSDGKGEVIAICHPHKETLEAFRLELAWLKKQQVDFVAASSLVHTY